jgi:hypothetical protein
MATAGGTKEAPKASTLVFEDWEGEPPAAPGRKARQPNPYDAPFKRSIETGKSQHVTIPANEVEGEGRADQLKRHQRMLRNAARFADKGADMRITETGIWFVAREKRTQTPAAA